jgi:hypothetical protein
MVLTLASALIIGLLGTAHLVLTYSGPRLLPRERALRSSMEAVSPVISSHTTIWRCWIGFNASHSMGAMLFGLTYGYLALEPTRLLQSSAFLQVVGACTLAGYVVLAKRYWFNTPLLGATAALLLFVADVWRVR